LKHLRCIKQLVRANDRLGRPLLKDSPVARTGRMIREFSRVSIDMQKMA
jgi:hypothetical protein